MLYIAICLNLKLSGKSGGRKGVGSMKGGVRYAISSLGAKLCGGFLIYLLEFICTSSVKLKNILMVFPQ